MTRAAFPYVRASQDNVAVDAWMLTAGEDVREAPPYLDGWDYNTKLKLSRDIRVDVAALRAAAALDDALPLRLSVTSFSTATWARNCVYRHTITEMTEELTIAIELEGGELGGNLQLTTAVVLAAPGGTAEPFVAHIPSSILWSDRREIRLQGDAPLFPISVIDFERAAYPPGAGWHLDIGSDLDVPVHAALRLYLNSADSAVVTAFANAAAPRPEDQAIVRAVYADVARIMVEHALNQEELRTDADWADESLGFALHNLLRRFFPEGDDLSAARERRIEHPPDFSTELLGAIGVFR